MHASSSEIVYDLLLRIEVLDARREVLKVWFSNALVLSPVFCPFNDFELSTIVVRLWRLEFAYRSSIVELSVYALHKKNGEESMLTTATV
jgi:hypothetical protein